MDQNNTSKYKVDNSVQMLTWKYFYTYLLTY